MKLLEEQLRRVEQRIDALLLVGGFSGSEYLYTRVNVSRIELIRFSPSVCAIGTLLFNIGYADSKRTSVELVPSSFHMITQEIRAN